MKPDHIYNSLGNLGNPARIWAIPAIHADFYKLQRLHDAVYERFTLGDRLVYLGNYTGYGDNAAACIDEILTFRRILLSQRGMLTSDLVYLRGRQEEMWEKLLQLQFASSPTDVLLWMLGHGMGPTLHSYGICHHDGIEACRQGVMQITKWTKTIRDGLRKHRGHETFLTQLKRAAYTDEKSAYPLLFVHAGLDPAEPLERQGDHFWWSDQKFDQISQTYNPFQKVVRGYDPKHRGLNMNCIKATIDDGCGFGGSLVCAGFEDTGAVNDILHA